MTDRELLELAAKAEGREVKYMTVTNARGEFVEKFIACWNPLTDDGDALRLAVKLGIRIAHMGERACAFFGLREFWEPEAGEPYTATRRAIVRAAAEIGKAMP